MDDFSLPHFPSSSFAQFSKMNISICRCLIREKYCSFSGFLNCIPKTEGWETAQVTLDPHHALCWPRRSFLRPGLQFTAPPWLPSCPAPPRVCRPSLTAPPPSVLPWAIPTMGTASQRPHTEEDGEKACVRPHVEPLPTLDCPPLNILQCKTLTESHWARPLASKHNY